MEFGSLAERNPEANGADAALHGEVNTAELVCYSMEQTGCCRLCCRQLFGSGALSDEAGWSEPEMFY